MVLAACLACEDDYRLDYESEHIVDVVIGGKIRLKTDGSGIKNVPVEAMFIHKQEGYSWFPPVKKITSGKSDKNGNFGLNFKIDTMDFSKWNLHIRIPVLEDYISTPYTPKELRYIEKAFSSYTENIHNIDFEFYSKTILKIDINRVKNDIFWYFNMQHEYNNEIRFLDFSVIGSENAKSASLSFEVPSDIYTKVTSIKRIDRSTEEVYYNYDSLICKKGADNTITINY
jgi:hypothetical protein